MQTTGCADQQTTAPVCLSAPGDQVGEVCILQVLAYPVGVDSQPRWARCVSCRYWWSLLGLIHSHGGRGVCPAGIAGSSSGLFTATVAEVCVLQVLLDPRRADSQPRWPRCVSYRYWWILLGLIDSHGGRGVCPAGIDGSCWG